MGMATTSMGTACMQTIFATPFHRTLSIYRGEQQLQTSGLHSKGVFYFTVCVLTVEMYCATSGSFYSPAVHVSSMRPAAMVKKAEESTLGSGHVPTNNRAVPINNRAVPMNNRAVPINNPAVTKNLMAGRFGTLPHRCFKKMTRFL